MRPNPPIPWRRRLAAMLAGAAAVLTFLLLLLFPGLAEAVYGNGVGPTIASLLSRISGLLPLSLAELVMLGFVARQLWGAVRGINDLRWRRRAPGNAALAGVSRLGADLGVVVALFYLLWGFHYARPPLLERYGWNGAGAEVAELSRLAEEMVEAANIAYRDLHGSEDAGEPTKAGRERSELMKELEGGWDRTREVFGEPSLPTFGFGPPKALLSSRLLDYLGTSGFYSPWTGEANFNAGIPAMSLPHVLAHEMAHQRGFAREDEADFAGFLAAASAESAHARYSAYVFAQRQLLLTLDRSDPERVLELLERRSPGVQRDIDAAHAYWARFRGPATRIARSFNDAYLKTHRVPGGVLSYRRSVELLIAYSRSHGGRLGS